MDDRIPEARNLSIASAGFFIYYAAGGYFTESAVTLELVNLSFKNSELLGWIAWVMLFWFAYRYWVETRTQGRKGIAAGMREFLEKSPAAKSYFLAQCPEIPSQNDPWRLQHVDPYGENGVTAVLFTRSAESGMVQHLADMKGNRGRKLLLLSLLHSCIYTPEVSRLAAPWFLFVLALVSALYVNVTATLPRLE